MFNSGSLLAFAYGSALAAAKNITAFSNANPGVATLEASHGIAVAEAFLIASNGWEIAEETIQRASAVAVNDVTVEGLDTSNLTYFPALAGVGTVQEVTTWSPVKGIIGCTINGDEQGFETLTPYGKGGRQIKIPTDRTPSEVELTFSHNAVAQSWFSALKKIDFDKTKTPFRISWSDGMKFYIYGFITLSQTPLQEGVNSPKGKIKITGNATLFAT